LTRLVKRYFKRSGIGIVAVATFALVACAGGLSEEEVQLRVDAGVATALAAIPGPPTPQPTPTPAPTATPGVPPTPQPAATPQPASTPAPAPTPQPTSTPAPVATPQPAATPQPTPTPAPTATPQPTALLADVYQQSHAAVFFVDTPGKTGTAFLFEPGLLLTNQHVIAGNSIVTLWSDEGISIPGTVVASDALRDIALIRINPSATTAIPLKLADSIGHNALALPLLAIGYSNTDVNGGGVGPAGANVGVLTRLITVNASLGEGFEMDAPVDPGDSGGPILNRNGEVIGISRAVVIATSAGARVVGTFLAIAIDEVHRALPGLRAGISR